MNESSPNIEPLRFRAIAMMSVAFEDCGDRARAQGLLWRSRDNGSGKVVVARDKATGARLKFFIDLWDERDGRIDGPSEEVEEVFSKLVAARILKSS